MLDRLANADTKVTLLLRGETAKYIRVASAGQGKTQSKFISDVLEGYGCVGSLDIQGLRSVLLELCDYRADSSGHIDSAVGRIISIFGIEEAD